MDEKINLLCSLICLQSWRHEFNDGSVWSSELPLTFNFVNSFHLILEEF